jgi:hypothetical protein
MNLDAVTEPQATRLRTGNYRRRPGGSATMILGGK